MAELGLIEFEWLRPHDGAGYRITPLRRGTRRAPAWAGGPSVLVLPRWKVPAEGEAGIETIGERQFGLYRPAAFTALFQIFADASPDAEGMRSFFDRFGPLEMADTRPQAGRISQSFLLGPLLAYHAALRQAVTALGAGDLSDLTAHVNAGWGQIRTELRAADGNLHLVFAPASLIQFLWLQLALHAASSTRLLRCAYCGQPFRTGTGTSRRGTSKFCSNACKSADWRRRRQPGSGAAAVDGGQRMRRLSRSV